MKKYILLIILLIALSKISFTQEMIINQPYNLGSMTPFNEYSTPYDSLSKIPENIQKSIATNFEKILGNLKPFINYSHGQKIDLERWYKDNPENIGSRNFPAYQLYFFICDTSIGMERFNLRLELDDDGELLNINWPKTGCNDKTKFQSRDAIEKFVLTKAKSKGYYKPDSMLLKRPYSHAFGVSFRYDSLRDKLVWVFEFEKPKKDNTCWQYFNMIEVNWLEIEITDEYERRWTPCY